MANDKKTTMLQGRLLWCNGKTPFLGQVATDQTSKQPKINKAGNQYQEFAYGLAVPKNAIAEMWNIMHEEAYKIFPSRMIPKDFSMKYKDGDTDVDQKGVPYSQREGYAGCLVFTLKTTFLPQFFRYNSATNKYEMINEGIKCGDYIQAQVSVEGHAAQGTAKAGLYVNPLSILFLGYGTEIVNAPSGEMIFGASAPQLPPGASATPVGHTSFPGVAAPQPQGYQQPAPVVPGYPQGSPQAQQQQYQPPMPAAAPIPNYAVLPPQYQPPMPAAAPGMPAMPGQAPQAFAGQPAPAAYPNGMPAMPR